MLERAIRSGAHRRILGWLRHGPATVSELAQAFDMRMPHASLACRQLRSSGLVVRDETGGLRKAPMYLSQLGSDRLRADGLAKLRMYAVDVEALASNLVLQADDDHVLLGYTEQPNSSLVFIPNRTIGSSSVSKGNHGGSWVYAPVEHIEWYDLRDFKPTQPPSRQPMATLDDYRPKQTRVGLVRGEVFERSTDAALVEGHIFSLSAAPVTPSPLRLKQGTQRLGAVVGTQHDFFPSNGVLAQLPVALERTLVLKRLGAGVLELSDRMGLRRRTLPLDVLDEWLQLRHTRMTADKRGVMLSDLIGPLARGSGHLTPTLRRELNIDFGDVEWGHSHLESGLVDIYGMSQRGVHAVIQYLLAKGSQSFVVDWPFDGIDEGLLSQTLAHPSCVGWVMRKYAPSHALSRAPDITPSQHMGVVKFAIDRRITLPIDLRDVVEDIPGPVQQDMNRCPLNAIELLAGTSPSRQVAYSGRFLDDDEGKHLQQGLRLFPTGNEEWANTMELKSPLASWIASPPEQRVSRWMRIKQHLPHGWNDLMDVSSLKLSQLPEAMKKASIGWQRKALLRLQSEAAMEPTIILDLAEGLTAEPHRSWSATCLLAVLDPYDEGRSDVFKRATSLWFDEPHCAEFIVQHVFSTPAPNAEAYLKFLDSWRLPASMHPAGSLLYVWSQALEHASGEGPWPTETQRLVMEVLPSHWWSPYALDWLQTQVGSSAGRAWLSEHPICWPAIIGLPEGSQAGLPGRTTPHPPLRLSSDDLIGIKMLRAGPGVAMLDDLYEMLFAHERHLPVPVLSSHPFAGWLVRPETTWPMFDESVLAMGDHRIGNLLFARSFNRILP